MFREKRLSLQERPRYIIPPEKLPARGANDIWSSHDLSLKKRLISPALPGYTGYVPGCKISGLGMSYCTRTKLNLTEFWRRRQDKMQLTGAGGYNVQEGKLLPPVKGAANTEGQRRTVSTTSLYTTHGMIPSYTGHMPGHYARCGISFSKSSKVTGHELTKM